MSRQSARAIVIRNRHLLVMHRNKFGSKYVTLPGGAIEPGEKFEDCALRELKEETSISVENPQLVFIDHAEFYGDQFVFLCDYVSGEPELSQDSQEFEINKLGKNLYRPGWLDLSELETMPFLSAELKLAISTALVSGWPMKPVEFISKRNVK